MKNTMINSDRVTLYSYLDRETAERVHVCGKLPTNEYDGLVICLLDWKIYPGAKSVSITYQLRPGDPWSPIFDVRVPVVQDRFALPKPNKSRYWKLDQYGDFWRNEKTGKKVYVD